MSEEKNSSQPKKNWFLRHKIISVILLIFVVIVVAAACSPTTPAKPAQVQSVFDVPSLIGKNVDDITKTLGKADKDDEPTAQQLALGTKEWWKSYKKDGYELLVTYNPTDRKVIDFFISSTSDSESTNEGVKNLLTVGNVKQDASNYSVEFVKVINNPNKFTGVKITPNK